MVEMVPVSASTLQPLRRSGRHGIANLRPAPLGGAQRTARRPWREPATARRSLTVAPTSLIHSLSIGASDPGGVPQPRCGPSRDGERALR